MTSTYRTARGPIGARINLGRFVRDRADLIVEKEGFGFVAQSDAPGTYPQLRAAYAHSKSTGDPLPVSSLHQEDTIFLEPNDNACYRFWHDMTHCELGLSFDLADEWELALVHLRILAAAGLGPETLEYRLLRADLLGQIILLAITGRYPWNQGVFSRTCWEFGLDEGIFTEIGKVS